MPLAIAALCASAIGTTGCASGPAGAAPAMILGEAAHPPAGFLEFCQRAPLQCAEARQARPGEEGAAQSIQVEARRQMWAAVFNINAPTPASGVRTETLTSAPYPSAAAAQTARAAATGSPLSDQALPAGPVGLDTGGPVNVAPLTVNGRPSAPPAGAPLPMTPALWAELNAVNERVNRAIVYREDMDVYGVEDYWNTPLLTGLHYGDCEDYVLEKRRALVADGLPASALSIAIVASPSGAAEHAVLLVSTSKGEYTLDNQTTWILPWNKTGYRWEERQRPNSVFDWVKVATAIEPNGAAKASR